MNMDCWRYSLRQNVFAKFSMISLLSVLATGGQTQTDSAAGRPMDSLGKTRVVMLGTGTPQARPEASGPAVAIVAGGAVYLVDAGPGVVRRAVAAAEKGIAVLRVQNMKTVFVTPLHADHALGLRDVIFSS
jgi:hypothetical protein